MKVFSFWHEGFLMALVFHRKARALWNMPEREVTARKK